MSAVSEAPSTVVLVGNPNSGKSTLFNALTGANQRVGNFAGVTVEVKTGIAYTNSGTRLNVLDLPGCYSLRANSPDEKIALDALTGKLEGTAKPDLVICVVDASNLERHLQLVLQVIELGLPCVLALNMVDIAEKTGLRLDPAKLSEELGIPVVPMQANAGKGTIELKQALRHPFPPPSEASWLVVGDDAEAQRRVFVSNLCELAARRPDSHQRTFSDKLDSVLLHWFLGWVALVAVMFHLFLRLHPHGSD
jgi:ferrous iron transport protein B